MTSKNKAAKSKFTATFADGTTITRSSAHAYTVAWRATWTDDNGFRNEVTGFAVSREKASPQRPGKALLWRGMSTNDRARAKRENAAYIERSGYRVEFAAAVKA